MQTAAEAQRILTTMLRGCMSERGPQEGAKWFARTLTHRYGENGARVAVAIVARELSHDGQPEKAADLLVSFHRAINESATQ